MKVTKYEKCVIKQILESELTARIESFNVHARKYRKSIALVNTKNAKHHEILKRRVDCLDAIVKRLETGLEVVEANEI